MNSGLNIKEFDKLSGEDFERILASVFSEQGFSNIEFTKKSNDFGIDVLAQKDGQTFGIQIKRSKSPVGVKAVQEVVSGAIYYDCDKSLLITNSTFTNQAMELADKAKVVLVNREQLKGWVDQVKLDFVSRITPHPYQKTALENLSQSRQAGKNRSLIIMASGLGKTYLAALDIRSFQNRIGRPIKTLYLAHQGVILEQANRSFGNVFGENRTYGKFDGTQKDIDKEFLFATFQSTHKSLAIFDAAQFDYIVVDEAHHTAATTRDQVVGYFRPRFLLGLTATPNRFDGKDVYQYYDDNVAINLPLEMALAQDLLTPVDYRVYTDSTKLDNPAIDLDENEREDYFFEPRSDQEIVQIIRKTSAENFSFERTIIFCNSIEQMNRFAKLFTDCATICGDDNREQQIKTVDDFAKGKYPLLLARDVLNEGIDVPSANLIVFLRNSESPVVFLQQLGRGLRKAEGKTKVIVLDFVGNIDRVRFVYSFYSKLKAYLRKQSTDSPKTDTHNTITFDDTARNIVQTLISKKERSGIIISVDGLTAMLDYSVNTATIRKFISKGILIPDYELSDKAGKTKYYMERYSLTWFMRQIMSLVPLQKQELIHERILARKINRSIDWLRKKERFGNFCPSWIHKDINGKYNFYYDLIDLEEVQKHL